MKQWTVALLTSLSVLGVLGGLMLAVAVVRPREQPDAPPTAIPADDIPPDLFHDVVSAHEDDREVHDFIIAPPELIQRSLQGKEVLIYGQP